MQNLILFLLVSLFLLICIRQGLTANLQKRTAGWLIAGRMCLFILLIAKIVGLLTAFNWLPLLQTCLLIFDFIIIEMAFRKKRLTFGDPHLNNLTLGLTFLILLVNIC